MSRSPLSRYFTPVILKVWAKRLGILSADSAGGRIAMPSLVLRQPSCPSTPSIVTTVSSEAVTPVSSNSCRGQKGVTA